MGGLGFITASYPFQRRGRQLGEVDRERAWRVLYLSDALSTMAFSLQTSPASGNVDVLVTLMVFVCVVW